LISNPSTKQEVINAFKLRQVEDAKDNKQNKTLTFGVNTILSRQDPQKRCRDF
jgi:hypothetical protein